MFVDCTKKLCDFDGNVKKLLDKVDLADNLAVNTRGASNVVMAGGLKGFRDLAGTPAAPVDLGFKNSAAGDFALKINARVRQENPAFKPIPVERIGLVRDEYRRQLPGK